MNIRSHAEDTNRIGHVTTNKGTHYGYPEGRWLAPGMASVECLKGLSHLIAHYHDGEYEMISRSKPDVVCSSLSIVSQLYSRTDDVPDCPRALLGIIVRDSWPASGYAPSIIA
jgi:hypothetical protein